MSSSLTMFQVHTKKKIAQETFNWNHIDFQWAEFCVVYLRNDSYSGSFGIQVALIFAFKSQDFFEIFELGLAFWKNPWTYCFNKRSNTIRGLKAKKKITIFFTKKIKNFTFHKQQLAAIFWHFNDLICRKSARIGLNNNIQYSFLLKDYKVNCLQLDHMFLVLAVKRYLLESVSSVKDKWRWVCGSEEIKIQEIVISLHNM